jgi:hypothetical protein
MEIGERYQEISEAFDSIRDDAKALVQQMEDGKLDTWERFQSIWTKMVRGDIAGRFGKIKQTYLDVAKDSHEQIAREHLILESYRDFRGALKEAEVLALQVLKIAEGRLSEARTQVDAAVQAVGAYTGEDPAARAQLELARDEHLRALQDEEKRYQIAKDLADNLTVGYNTSEVVMARLMQTTNAKERVYAQAVSFFSTNESVLTVLSASFTGLHGLHESTQTLNAMKEGISKSLESLADVGGDIQKAALEAGYGPTIRADAVKRLVDSVVSFQEHSAAIISEMRELSTRNAQEIHAAIEAGKKRLATLATQGKALTHG